MTIPDIKCFILDNAVSILRDNGIIKYKIKETVAPGQLYNESEKVLRVLRTETDENGELTILVCRTYSMPLE